MPNLKNQPRSEDESPVEREPWAYEFNVDDLIMSATDHYLGRSCVGVSVFCDRLIRSWDRVSPGVRQYVRKIVEAAFVKEDRFTAIRIKRFAQRVYTDGPLGSNVDRVDWERVRALWQEKTDGGDKTQTQS